MVDLHNVGTFNVDTRFKTVEKTIAVVVGTSIGSLLLLTILNSYINSYKEAGQFKHRSFRYYDQLTAIYAKD
ncbi:hypothetical protein Goklo_024686 [Gossypium klotzschianum]|uniref:Uncharacterized protein n=1 Tax=Gossypium klotzschianum TaxID=34286 RepID=A0A7J8W6D9_9ROSI|nr:hypothetical protein [Gossypium klotzschianum]